MKIAPAMLGPLALRQLHLARGAGRRPPNRLFSAGHRIIYHLTIWGLEPQPNTTAWPCWLRRPFSQIAVRMTRIFCSGVLLSSAWDIIGESNLSRSCLELIASAVAESHLIAGFHVEVPRRFSCCPKLAVVQMQRFPMVRPFWVLPYSSIPQQSR